MPLDIITFNNCVTQSVPLAVDASFQFVDVRDLGTVVITLQTLLYKSPKFLNSR